MTSFHYGKCISCGKSWKQCQSTGYFDLFGLRNCCQVCNHKIIKDKHNGTTTNLL